jgi:hypothetical protein
MHYSCSTGYESFDASYGLDTATMRYAMLGADVRAVIEAARPVTGS